MKLTEGRDPDLQVKCQHDAAILTRIVNNVKKLLHSRSNMKTMPTFSLTAEVWCNYGVILRSANQETGLTTVRQCGRIYLHFQQKHGLFLPTMHKEFFAQKFLPKNKIPVLPQPSHTQDLSPVDIFLFPKL
jgi:DTW domain-containing protein YfiP